jgi:hypothetical protein
MVTVGTTKRSISIRAAETWYCMAVSAVDEEVFISIGLPVVRVVSFSQLSPLKKNEKCRIVFFNRLTG